MTSYEYQEWLQSLVVGSVVAVRRDWGEPRRVVVSRVTEASVFIENANARYSRKTGNAIPKEYTNTHISPWTDEMEKKHRLNEKAHSLRLRLHKEEFPEAVLDQILAILEKDHK